MEQHISIARPADAVFAYIANPDHLPAWLPQLRREESPLPRKGLHADHAARTIRWTFSPAGSWTVRGEGESCVLSLHLDRETAIASDPTEHETPQEAALHGVEAALQSLKSHLEHAGGGDPELQPPGISSRVYGHGQDDPG